MTYLSLFKSYPRYLGFGATYNFFSSLGQTFLFALFIPDLEKAFNLTHAQSGSYYGIASLISAFLLLYTGSLIDRIHLRTYSTTIAFLLGTSALLMASADSLAVMLLAMFLLRHLGQGLMAHTASISITRYFTHTRGKAISVNMLGVYLSQALLPVTIALIIATYDWRVGYIVLGIGCLLLCMPLNTILLKKDDPFQLPHPKESATAGLLDEEELNWGRKELLSHSYFWLILPVIIAPAFIFTALFFHQGTLAEHQGWSLPLIASGFVSFSIMGILGTFIIGPVIDKFSAKHLLAIANIPMCLALVTLLITKEIWTVYIYMGLIGTGISFTANIKAALWAEVYGKKHLGSIKSLTTTLAILGTAASPPLVGIFLTKGTPVDNIILCGVIYIIVASILALVAKVPKVKQ